MNKKYSLILKNLRTESDKTLKDVEKDTGIKATALSNYENGIRVPRDEWKIILARYYGKTVDEIFFTQQ